MRRLMLLRHAKAERAAPGMIDRDRSLAARGHADAATIGIYMARHGLIPDRALISPARRTRETWEQAVRAFVPPPSLTFERRIYGAGPQILLQIVGQSGPAVRTLLLIGHNPGLHELATMLIASGDLKARQSLNEKLPTAGLVVIDFALEGWHALHAQSGRLERFVTPRSLVPASD